MVPAVPVVPLNIPVLMGKAAEGLERFLGIHEADAAEQPRTDLRVEELNKIIPIRGVTYSAVGKGDDRTDGINWDTHIRDITLLKEMGANTIRTYYPITSTKFLDALAANGVKVIINFPSYDDRRGAGPDISRGGYKNYIQQFKNHPAILMWEFGNEYNYHPEWFNNDINNWYRMLEDAAGTAKRIDPSHKVATAHGDMTGKNIVKRLPSVDVWGVNVYRGDNPSGVIGEWKALLRDKEIPDNLQLYISETGTDAFDGRAGRESQKMQAKVNETIWKRLVENADSKVFLGVTFMTFADEWWKAGNPGRHDESGISSGGLYDNQFNEEWWGFVDINRKPREVFEMFKQLWAAGTAPAVTPTPAPAPAPKGQPVQPAPAPAHQEAPEVQPRQSEPVAPAAEEKELLKRIEELETKKARAEADKKQLESRPHAQKTAKGKYDGFSRYEVPTTETTYVLDGDKRVSPALGPLYSESTTQAIKDGSLYVLLERDFLGITRLIAKDGRGRIIESYKGRLDDKGNLIPNEVTKSFYEGIPGSIKLATRSETYLLKSVPISEKVNADEELMYVDQKNNVKYIRGKLIDRSWLTYADGDLITDFNKIDVLTNSIEEK